MRSTRLLSGLIFCAAIGHPVEPGKPSRTAALVLEMRALGLKLPESEMRNPDVLADRFFGARERQVLSDANQPVLLDLDFMDAWTKLGIQQRIFLHVLARTRAIDQLVREEVQAGATQLVILGAGYDSRAYRMKELFAGATIFEVDFPPTQELKKLRVREVLGHPPKNVVFVPIDFNTDSLGPVLKKAGYHSDRRTIFVWEGVTFYLNAAAVDVTLRFVAANSPPGSAIVFDYESDRLPSGEHDDAQLKEAMARLARWGEPHIFGLPVGNTRPFVEQRGLCGRGRFCTAGTDPKVSDTTEWHPAW